MPPTPWRRPLRLIPPPLTTLWPASHAAILLPIAAGTDLGGTTLTPGVYCFASTAQLTGTLTLDAQGNPGAVWVFEIGSVP